MGRARLLAIVPLPLLLLVACDPDAGPEQVEFRVPVTAAEVSTDTVEDLIVTTGTLRAPEAVVLVAESPGRLEVSRGATGRRLAEGDRVEAGQVLAAITGEDARLAARTEATEQRYQVAKQEYERRKRLFESEQVISEEELRKAEAVLAEAKHEWERSRLTEDRNRIVTPISGIVLHLARDQNDVPVADGQLVVPGFQVAKVAPVSPLVADVDLVGPELARVRPGLEARVRHYAFEGLSFPGEVIRLSPSIDPRTHTFRAEVEVANEQELLRPGMFVEVTLIAERREGVPVVPREAVTERGGRRVVFGINGQRVEEREIALGLGDDAIVEIRRGLEPGERIVVRGLETLTDGTRVRVTE